MVHLSMAAWGVRTPVGRVPVGCWVPGGGRTVKGFKGVQAAKKRCLQGAGPYYPAGDRPFRTGR